jgi:hypothetical protein
MYFSFDKIWVKQQKNWKEEKEWEARLGTQHSILISTRFTGFFAFKKGPLSIIRSQNKEHDCRWCGDYQLLKIQWKSSYYHLLTSYTEWWDGR